MSAGATGSQGAALLAMVTGMAVVKSQGLAR